MGYNTLSYIGEEGSRMPTEEQMTRIAELTAQIAKLPKGYISQKMIGGQVYFYHQWSEQGQKQSRYLRDSEIEPLTRQIEQRKRLQAELRELRTGAKRKKPEEAGQLKCVLMHKSVPVAQIELDDVSGFIQKIDTVFAPEHLPVGVAIRHGRVDRAELNDWWTERSIPASRSGVREALEMLDITNTRMLLVRCLGLSLSDQYWILPDGSPLTWEQINFFDNPFSDDIGDVLFGATKKADNLNFSSPDSTSDGNLKKRWKIIDGKRCLIKGGSNPFRQQPFNEVIAALLMERLGIEHVPYSVVWNRDAPYSVCEDFITGDTELVTAWRIIQTQKRRNEVSAYRHFVNCAQTLGIPDVIPFLDRMLVLDYLIANEDRHLNNFGAIRNAETLEWIGMAPIYDSGSSLGYDKVASEIRSGRNVLCKPFKRQHEEQLMLVTDFSWIDFEQLKDARELIVQTLSADDAGEYVGANRIEAIADSVQERIRYLRELSMTQREAEPDSVRDDVEQNIAADYTPKMTM